MVMSTVIVRNRPYSLDMQSELNYFRIKKCILRE